MLSVTFLRVSRHQLLRLAISQSSIPNSEITVTWPQLTNQQSCNTRKFSSSASANQQAGYKLKNNVGDCYSLLNVQEDCTDEELREAFLKLAKVYHPDSGTSTADARKFSQVRDAYHAAKRHRESPEVTEVTDLMEDLEDEGEVVRVRHTVPQHRQYLTFEGVGFGSPSQRQRQYQQYRVNRATEKVHDHRVTQWAIQKEGALVVREKAEAKKSKISNAIERVVEDLIQESMKNGDFDNLPGAGKPLNFSERNPMVDTMTHNLNKILINNGYTPEWITLEKEIREEIKMTRGRLAAEIVFLGLPPFESDFAIKRWNMKEHQFRDSVLNINSLIHKFNMMVPIMEKQLIPYNVNKEVEKVKSDYEKYANDAPTDYLNVNSSGQREPTYKEEPFRWKHVWKDIRDSFGPS